MIFHPLSYRTCVFVSLWLSASSISKADVAVAPPPREVRQDGSRDAVPETGPKENPLEVVERIVKNSKVVGDKLAKTDTGAATRGTQKIILKDIDKLIDQQDNPPSSGGADSQNKDKNTDMNPKGGKDPKGGMQPMGGNQQASSGRKPRQGEKGGQPPMQPGKEQPSSKQEKGMTKADTKMGGPKGPAGGAPKGKTVPKPSLPIDDAVVKEVWGHLPDKLRQQVSQYYKEQFMPKYSELLKQYYSSLANAQQKP